MVGPNPRLSSHQEANLNPSQRKLTTNHHKTQLNELQLNAQTLTSKEIKAITKSNKLISIN